MPKARFTHLPIGPWPKGVAWPERVTDFEREQLEDAVNVNIRPEGSIVTAPNWVQVLSSTDCHSLYKHRGTVYGVVGGEVGVLSETGFSSLRPVSGPISWTDIAGVPYFADRDAVYRVDYDTMDVIQLTASQDADDIDDQIVPMPGGHWLSYWNGRLVVARGGSILFSQPLRYGAHNPVTDYITLRQKVEWMVPLETGIFVGLDDRVLWLAGDRPQDMRVNKVADNSAPGMGLAVPAESMGIEGRHFFAIFFSESGFAIGDDMGGVKYPQAAGFEKLPLFRGKLVRDGSRIFAIRGL